MIVVVILAILATMVTVNVIDRPDEARITSAKTEISQIKSALQLYRIDNINYPTGEQGLSALVERPTADPVPKNWKPGGYLSKLPTDPWGNPYQYLNPGVHDQIDVFSYGADGAPGGEGNDADIGSWDL